MAVAVSQRRGVTAAELEAELATTLAGAVASGTPAETDQALIIPASGPARKAAWTALRAKWNGGLTGEVARALSAKLGDAVSIRDFGAIGDGQSHPVSEWLAGGSRDQGYANLAAIQADYPHVGALTNEIDWAAAQKAIDVVAAAGGGGVYVPGVRVGAGQFYRLNGYPLLLRDFVTVFGDGPSSLIKNVLSSTLIFMDTAVILPGNYHPEYMNSLTFDTASNVTEGDQILTLADTSRYSVGMTIVARTNDYTPGSTTDVGAWARFYRVISKTATTLSLDAPIEETHTNVLVSPANDQLNWRNITGHTRQKVYACYRGGLRDLAIGSTRWWIGDSAAIECNFHNLHIEAEAGVYGNAFQRCSWRSIRGTVYRIVMEMSMHSYATHVEDLVMTWRGDNLTNYQLASMQERAAHCSFRSARIIAPTWSQTAAALRLAARNCVIDDVTLIVPQAAGAAISIENASDINNDNLVRDVQVIHGAALTVIAQVNPTGTGTASRNVLSGIRGRSTVAHGATWSAYKVGGAETEVLNCLSDDANAQLQVVTGATGAKVRENKVPAGIIYSDGGTTLSRTNTVEGNHSTASETLRRVRYKQAGGRTDVTSTTTNNQVQSLSIPGGSLAAGDKMFLRARGDTGAEAVTKEIRITFGGNTIGSLSLASGETGLWSIEVEITARNTNEMYAMARQVKDGAETITRYNVTGLGLILTAYSVDLRAWLGGAGHIYVEDYEFTPQKVGFAA